MSQRKLDKASIQLRYWSLDRELAEAGSIEPVEDVAADQLDEV